MNLRLIVALSCIGAALSVPKSKSKKMKMPQMVPPVDLFPTCGDDSECGPDEKCGPGVCVPTEVVDSVKRCIETPCEVPTDCAGACGPVPTECAEIMGESWCMPELPFLNPPAEEKRIKKAVEAKKARNANPQGSYTLNIGQHHWNNQNPDFYPGNFGESKVKH